MTDGIGQRQPHPPLHPQPGEDGSGRGGEERRPQADQERPEGARPRGEEAVRREMN